MTKFKIGDRVKCTSPDSWGKSYGKIGIIDEICEPPEDDNPQAYTVFFDITVDGWGKNDKYAYIGENHLELLEENHLELLNSLEKIYFARTKLNAIIPSKKDENAGYDVYACFNQENIVIQPHETVMIPTGIASCCSPDYYFQLFERGSTGTKGIGQRCGVIDSGYRKEWFVPITNHNTKPLIIIKNLDKLPKDQINFYYDGDKKIECIPYSYDKAICQAVLLPVPKTEVIELSYEKLLDFKSERGLGCLGSSNK